MADKKPHEMTDEELDKVIAEPLAEPEIEEAVEPVEEETPEEIEEPEETPEEPEEPEEEPVSKRQEKRALKLEQLLEKLKQEKTEVEPPKTPEALDYEKTLDADPELIKKLEEDRQKSNRAMYEQGIAQANSIRFHTRLEIDAPRIEAKYPQIDKTSDKFNPRLANAINSKYLQDVGYDPQTDTVRNANIRYSDYVEAMFELAEEIAGEEIQSSKKNLVKQAAKTGLRPDGSSPKRLNLNKFPHQMTDEELDAAIKAGM